MAAVPKTNTFADSKKFLEEALGNSRLAFMNITMFMESIALLHGASFLRVFFKHPTAENAWVSIRMVLTASGFCYEVCVSWKSDTLVTYRSKPIAHEVYDNDKTSIQWVPNQETIQIDAEKKALTELARVIGRMLQINGWGSGMDADEMSYHLM